MGQRSRIGGEPADGQRRTVLEVRNPFSDDVVAEVPLATRADVDDALDAAVRGASRAAKLTGHERAEILERAAALCDANAEGLADTVVREQGKTLAEAGREAARVGPLLRLCAGEARRVHGETLPLDGEAAGAGKLGLTLRVPAGVVVAITPFNFPLLLVAHKLGPALAAGNAVILKPASLTPLSALRLVEILLESGWPEEALQCVVGPGAEVALPLTADERVRVVSFTGSLAGGRAVAAAAGVKRLCLELGANCPTLVLDDASIDDAIASLAIGGYANAGQVCISAQRVLVDRSVYGDVLDALGARVSELRAGDPARDGTDVGPLVTEDEAVRVARTVEQAVEQGARLVTGGDRDGSVYAPTVVADVAPGTGLFDEELFGPALAVTAVETIEEGLRLVNAGSLGLAAAIFTRDVDRALRFVRDGVAGVLHVNNSPLWRADAMPYGGLRQSGIGKEGVADALREFTDVKTVVFH